MPDPPFIQFAKRILSISANSASCERLFSLFGSTLTKLRNRLGTETLTALSELKMHIRDEHIRNKSSVRLKRHFGARKNQSTTSADPSPMSVVPQPSSSDPLPAMPTSQEIPPLDDHDELDPPDSLINPSIPNPQSDSSFRSIVQDHSSSATEDDRNNEATPSDCDVMIKSVRIDQLFNFSVDHWVSVYSRSPLRSFDEELELYELLDLDAEGEDDDDIQISVDESMEQILIG